MADVVIVPAEAADAGEVLTLQRAAYVDEARLYGDVALPPLVQTLDELARELPSVLALKAVLGQRIVGSVRGRLDGAILHIGRPTVAPDLQGRGIGSLLLAAIERQAPAAVEGFALFTGHLSTANLRLYQRLGYREVRREELSPSTVLVHLEKARGKSFVLGPDTATLHGYFSRDYPAVLTIDPGDTVTFGTLDAFWSSGPFEGGSFPDRPRVEQYEPGAGHALTGPVAVRGARPGMALEVRIDAVVPATWGTTVAGGWPSSFNDRYGIAQRGVVHSWDLDPATMTGRNQHGHTVALHPFLGVMGMPPAEPGRHSTIPPRAHGGNLDCKELVAGSTLYLPVPVDEALFSVGDGHAAQGDGEVSGTAIECPMERVELTFGLREDLALTAPLARTPAGWVAIGLGETLDDAAFQAMEGMIALLGRLLGVQRADAIALASVAVDLRVTQLVNRVVGVHAVLAPAAITG